MLFILSLLYFEMPTCLRHLCGEKSSKPVYCLHTCPPTKANLYGGTWADEPQCICQLNTEEWNPPPHTHTFLFYKAPNQLTQTEKSSQRMHECSCIRLPAEFLLCLGAHVSLCKNAINPGAVGFSARYGKIGPEYLFTAHPFKTWGLFLFVWLALG